MSGPAAEFDLIARYFRPLAGPGGLDLLDDAALLAPPPGRELVLTADAMVEGVHFLPDDLPDLVARKLLRVNLSDLAAKGAVPLGYLLTLSARRGTEESWFEGFAAGLAEDGRRFGLELLGGDTTSTPGPVSLSLTAIGHVAPGAMVRRLGARPGDGLHVTGTIGRGALGLRAIRGELPDPGGHLAASYRLPEPRLGLIDPGWARAAMDVSDGLVQDLGHLLAGLGATIRAQDIPVVARGEWLEACLTGGDDYELLVAVPPGAAPPPGLTRIGTVETRPGLRILDAEDRPMVFSRPGWSHF